MTEEELKVKFNYIQGIFNRCINHAYQIITDSIVAKSEYLNREQADELEQQECTFVPQMNWHNFISVIPYWMIFKIFTRYPISFGKAVFMKP